MLETYLEEETPDANQEYRNCFHARKPPSVSLHKYLERLSDYMKCSEECYVLAMIYIERLMKADCALTLNSLCVHRLILSAVAIAAKFFDDKYYKNSYYARVGGISVQEINTLERNFLFIIDFNLYVSDKQYSDYHNMLLSHFGGDN